MSGQAQQAPAASPFRQGPEVDIVYVHEAPTRTVRSTMFGPTASEIVGAILRVTPYSAHRLVAVEPAPGHPVIEVREDVPVGRGLTICVIANGPQLGELVRAIHAARRGEQ